MQDRHVRWLETHLPPAASAALSLLAPARCNQLSWLGGCCSPVKAVTLCWVSPPSPSPSPPPGVFPKDLLTPPGGTLAACSEGESAGIRYWPGGIMKVPFESVAIHVSHFQCSSTHTHKHTGRHAHIHIHIDTHVHAQAHTIWQGEAG